MYNLTVDEAHTFFVGEGQWLVHNACNYDLTDLGTDPANNKFRVWEANTGERLVHDYIEPNFPEVTSLSRLNERVHPTKAGDWIDSRGITYDGVSVVPHPSFSVDQFKASIFVHMIVKRNIDYIVVDTTGLTNLADITDIVQYTKLLSQNPKSLPFIGLGPGW
jgi:hypothetical protein